MRVGPENAWAKEDMVISRACGWWLVDRLVGCSSHGVPEGRNEESISGVRHLVQAPRWDRGYAKLLSDGF